MDFGAGLTPRQQENLHTCVGLAQTCAYDATHTNQVARLALRLFDELAGIHHLNQKARYYLLCASILHDIGWIEGLKNHHKVALRIIMTTTILPFGNKERLIIGSIARYHRSALPDLHHDHYAALEPRLRLLVNHLAAILRLADGMDRSHRARVHDLNCEVTHKKIFIKCAVLEESPEEEQGVADKKDLMEKDFKREVVVNFILSPEG